MIGHRSAAFPVGPWEPLRAWEGEHFMGMTAGGRVWPAACLLLAVMAAAAAASEPVPVHETSDLFGGRTGGVFCHRIPGIVVTPRGTVLVYCEARTTSCADWGEIEVHMRRSTDGGRSFSPPRQVAHLGPRLPRNPANAEQPDGKAIGRDGEQTVNNPVAIVERDGTVHLLYCVEYMRCFHLRSTDDGVTWSDPVDITATFAGFRDEWPWRVIATGPGHGIQLHGGRLVVPVWLATSRGSAHHGAAVATIFSDDRGATWEHGEIICSNGDDTPSPTESAVAQCADGRVFCLIRNHAVVHRKLMAFSDDGATGWTRPAAVNDLPEPICMAGLASVDVGAAGDRRRWLLFSGPDSLGGAAVQPKPGKRRDRRNLSVKLSRDNGLTWPVSRVLEPGPSAYSDLAVLPDGTMLCIFERGRDAPAGEKSFPYARISLARFNLPWLLAEHDGVPNGTPPAVDD